MIRAPPRYCVPVKITPRKTNAAKAATIGSEDNDESNKPDQSSEPIWSRWHLIVEERLHTKRHCHQSANRKSPGRNPPRPMSADKRARGESVVCSRDSRQQPEQHSVRSHQYPKVPTRHSSDQEQGPHHRQQQRNTPLNRPAQHPF